jgi:predicted nucleic acid-binding protein
MIVLDASFAGALVLPDEPDPPPELEMRLIQGPLFAPVHWPLESANMLQNALRRQRIDRLARADALRQFDELLVSVDAGGADALQKTITFADRHDLTIYDAAYLELAVRRGAALASRDHDLIDAAAANGIDILTF